MSIKLLVPALAAALLLNSQAYAQEQQPANKQPGFKKNSIQATAGAVGLIAGYSLSYERWLLTSKQSALVGLWTKIGAGGWVSWTSGGPHQSLMLGTMTGKRNSHLELNMGLARMFDRNSYNAAKDVSDYYADPPPAKSNYVAIRAAGSLGYRYQKPTGRFIFRVGGGFPETLYLGIGGAF